ncbi:hypothetical protein BJ944DRAFT_264146 [Cunninghamella echinulata]|nr:hypothetical protein BJ944DRAFT_264146 [Cunninghamella echinulata]
MDNNTGIINARSFHFKQNPQLRDKPIRNNVKKIKKRKITLHTTQQLKQEQQQTEDESLPFDPSTILQGLTIYVDKSIENRGRLTSLARALAANVVDDWNLSVTHVIHGYYKPSSDTKRHITPRIITKSLSKQMRVVSPTWLLACYDEKKLLNETFYPYEMESNERIAPLKMEPSNTNSVLDDNPFGLDPDEYADTDNETEDDSDLHCDNNRKLTEFFQRNDSNSNSNDNSNNDQQYSVYSNDVDYVNNNNNARINNSNDNNQDNNNVNDNISIHFPSMDGASQGRSHSPPMFDSASIDDTITNPEVETITEVSDKTTSNRSWTPEVMLDMLNAMNASRREKTKLEKNKHDNNNNNTDQDNSANSNNNGTTNDDDDLQILPDLDPAIQPKKTLGREERFTIWYAEHTSGKGNNNKSANGNNTLAQAHSSLKKSSSTKKKKLSTSKNS